MTKVINSIVFPSSVQYRWAKEIKAWLDGAEIQEKTANLGWRTMKYDHLVAFNIDKEYRIKPIYPTLGEIAEKAFSDKQWTTNLARWSAAAEAVVKAIKDREFL